MTFQTLNAQIEKEAALETARIAFKRGKELFLLCQIKRAELITLKSNLDNLEAIA